MLIQTPLGKVRLNGGAIGSVPLGPGFSQVSGFAPWDSGFFGCVNVTLNPFWLSSAFLSVDRKTKISIPRPG